MVKKAVSVSLLALVLGGCAYGGVASAGGDKVVITRNDGFLLGLLRKVYVCKATDAGVTNCSSAEAP